MKLCKSIGVILALEMSMTLCMAANSAPRNQNGNANHQKRSARAKKQRPLSLMQFKAEDLAAALSLTPDLKDQITAIHQKYQSDRKSLMANVQGTPDPATKQQLRAELKQANEGIAALLSVDQKKSLTDLIKTERMLGRRMPLTTVQKLNLTDDQNTQIKGIRKAAQEQIKNLSKDPANADATKTQRQAILKSTREKIMSILNGDQKALLARPKRGRRTNK